MAAQAVPAVADRKPKRVVDRIDIHAGMSPLAKRVEDFLLASGMTPAAFSIEVCGRRDLVADLRKGRKLGEVLEAKVKLYLSRQPMKPPPTEGVLTPTLQTIADRDREICGMIRVEAAHRGIEPAALLAQLVVIGWRAYADERGLG
jgi:hypothetical protein